MRSGSRNRWLFLVILAGGVASFSGLWYATTSNSSGSEPAFGGGYVEGVAGAPSRLNPLFAAQNDVDESLVALIFAGLTRLDDQGRPFPDLAETWSLSADGRVYTFILRPGLVWQDGDPLTADDVVFTYSLLRDPALRTQPRLSRLLAELQVSRADARTVRFELAQPFAPLPAYLTLGILPAHLLGQTPPAALFDDPFNQRPVGAGPYRLDELTPQRAVLAASPTHHLGQPFIQRFELRFFRDEGLLLAALKERQLSGALISSIAAGDLFALEQRGDLQLRQLATTHVTYVYLNLGSPLFADRRVRQALLLALDRDAIIRDVLSGQAQRADSPLPPGSWPYVPALRRFGFDPTVAGLLLDEAGWRLTTASVRLKDGQELAVRLSTNNDPLRLALAEEIAKRWTAIGVRVTVDAVGATTLVRDVLEPRSFVAVLFDALSEADPDPYSQWHGSQAAGKGLNLGGLRDDRFDRLIEGARLMASQPRREELYGQLQELFAQEVPAIPLYAETLLYVQKESLRGARLGYIASPGARFWQVQEWYLKTR